MTVPASASVMINPASKQASVEPTPASCSENGVEAYPKGVERPGQGPARELQRRAVDARQSVPVVCNDHGPGREPVCGWSVR
jgi:hypothetical protein